MSSGFNHVLVLQRINSQNLETTKHTSKTAECPDMEPFIFMENVEN